MLEWIILGGVEVKNDQIDAFLNEFNMIKLKTLCNQKRTIIEASDAFEEVTGISLDKIAPSTQKGYIDFITIDDKEEVLSTIFACEKKRRGEKFTLSYKIKTPQNQLRHVLEKGIIRRSANNKTYVESVIFEKISGCNYCDENKELKLKVGQYELIMDNIPMLIFYKDDQNNYLRVNKYIAEAHEMDKEEFTNVNMNKLYPSDVAEKYYEDDLEVIKSGESKINILETWDIDGISHWVNTSKIPVYNEKNKSRGIIGIANDITNQLTYERK